MKLSRRRKHTKRSKYTRHTKHGGGGKQYNTKRKYRKYSRKLKYKSRLQKGGMWRSGKVAPEPPSQLAPEPPTQLAPSQFEFPVSVPDPFTKLVEDTEDNMTVSPDYKTYTFENRSSREYPVFKSSNEEEARLMNLNFKKSEGSMFRSGDKIIPKQFKWRITLKKIEDITRSEGALRQYKYTYSIMLYRLSEKEGAITLETDVYVIISTAYKSNSIAANQVFIVNGYTPVDKKLSDGLTLQVYTNGTSTGNKTYTFPYGEQNNFNNITRVLSDLAYIGDLMVLKKLYTSLNSIDPETHKQEADNVAQAIVDFNLVNTVDFSNRRLCKIPAKYGTIQAIIDNKDFITSD